MVSIERKLAALPRRKQEMERDLGRLESMLHSELDKLDESRSFRRDQERQLDEEREQIRGSKARISQVKTPRELSAAQRELEATRRLAESREGELVRIDDAIAEAEGRIKGMEGGLGDLRVSFASERTRLDELEAKLERSHKKARRARKNLVEAIDKSLLQRYERIRKRVGGIGFVAVRECRCTACKMAVPHKTYVALKNAELIAACENCGRLLYWAGLFPEENVASEAKSEEAAGDE